MNVAPADVQTIAEGGELLVGWRWRLELPAHPQTIAKLSHNIYVLGLCFFALANANTTPENVSTRSENLRKQIITSGGRGPEHAIF